jgi:hypothetical protein
MTDDKGGSTVLSNVGSGDHCFSHNLHLSLLGSGAPAESLPQIGALRLLARILALSTAALALLAPSSAPHVSLAAFEPAQTCAWPLEAGVATANVGLPDSNAAYWFQSFVVQSNLQIVLRGRYPDARYASFNVYTSGGATFTSHGVGSALADYQIRPDRGSHNPWRQRVSPGGHFTVTVRADVAPHQVNTLPLAPVGTPSGSKGYLIYRIYLPAGGNFSAIPLPSVTLRQGASSRTLPACAHPHGPATVAPTPRPSPQPSAGPATPIPSPTPTSTAPVPKQLRFFRPASGPIALFPDADSADLIAYLIPPGSSKVVVLTAKAPRAPAGNHPSRWPARDEDVRYWSMCTYVGTGQAPVVANPVPRGRIDYGCRDNDATTLDAAGYYFFVLGRQSQRATIARIGGVTFLPFSAAQPTALHLLLLRNKLVNPRFPYSIQKVAQNGNPASAAAATGPYYPRAVVCPLSTLVARGPQACLPHP